MKRFERKEMKLVSVIIGFLMLLYGGGAAAALEAEYLTISAPDAAAGIPSGKLSWELRDSLGHYFNYRISGNDQAGFRFRDEQWIVHNITSDTHSASLLLDWHPMGGRFRISGGLFSYRQSFDYRIAPEVDEVFKYTLRINPQQMAANLAEELQEKGVHVATEDVQSMVPEDAPRVIRIRKRIEFNAEDLYGHAHVKYEDTAPYFGFGWSNPFSRYSHLRYSIDLGVLYQSEPDIQLSLGGDTVDNLPPAVQTWLDEWLFKQKLKLGKKLDDYNPTPRLGFGLSYSFY
ncbi:MAG TPA: hypothetical protein VFX02_07410 [Gammaproteobacteria bacterium]|nr:hypothetical protein [Gammaproteobacteria bacterium]